MKNLLQAHQLLQTTFGFPEWREGQAEVISALLAGKSTLAVFPTGGGKSLCYQIPALLLDGVTLVVSPLIALMKDQVDALQKRGIPAARLDSTLSAEESREVFAQLHAGKIKLLYIAPERLASETFRLTLAKISLALVAIDEAHCLSEWGHNFRPDYLKLTHHLKNHLVLALTATATPAVARDISEQFLIQSHVQRSFHRPNLHLEIRACPAHAKKSTLLKTLQTTTGSTIIYVTRQETAEEVATFLQKNGESVRAYHAGLPTDFRSETQLAFMNDEVRIMVATIAFGMGIDKPNVRHVIHYNQPKSLENYSQEVGRAGRDGAPAHCLWLANQDDLIPLENFIHGDTPSPRALHNLCDFLLHQPRDFALSLYDLAHIHDIRQTVIETLLTYLELEGAIEATGAFWKTFQVQPLRKFESLFHGLSPDDANELRELFQYAKHGRLWYEFDLEKIAETSRFSRPHITFLLQSLEQRGDVKSKITHLRKTYRLLSNPNQTTHLTHALIERFVKKEQSELTRLHQTLAFATHPTCLTQHLLAHFGEKFPTPCQHCCRCQGTPATPLPHDHTTELSPSQWQIIQEIPSAHALQSSRQKAKFLCGINSPMSIREKLTRHDSYGALASMPFPDVLTIVENLPHS